MTRTHPLLASLVFLLAAGPAVADKDDAFVSLVAAERRFAADAGRLGITPAFRAHAAPDALLFQPDPRPAAPILTGEDTPGTTLAWAPETAIVSASGDLGATTGPARLDGPAGIRVGRFLTVWRRDGAARWRWAIDYGLPPRPGTATAFPAVVRRLAGGARADAGTAVDAADDRLNAAWPATGASALPREADAVVLRDPVRGSEPAALRVRRLGTLVSRRRDLAVSYGSAEAADARRGHYLRVWRFRGGGWRVVIDQLVWTSPA